MSAVTNYLYDKLNDFGTLAAAGDFPNTMNMGEASAERMTVDIKLPDGSVTSGAGITFALMGSDTENDGYSKIVESGTVTADMLNEGYALPMPKTKFKFLKFTVSGSFSGKIQAIINSYLGK